MEQLYAFCEIIDNFFIRKLLKKELAEIEWCKLVASINGICALESEIASVIFLLL